MNGCDHLKKLSSRLVAITRKRTIIRCRRHWYAGGARNYLMLTWTECPILVVVGLRNKISPALTWRQLVFECHWQQVGPAALSRGTHFLPTTRPLARCCGGGATGMGLI